MVVQFTDKRDNIFEKTEQHFICRDIAANLRIDFKIVLTHLKKRWLYEEVIWIPHEFLDGFE